MAIATSTFITGLKDLEAEMLEAAEAGSPKASGYYEEQLGALITDLILSATVPAGIAVQVTPSTGTGATTGVGSLI